MEDRALPPIARALAEAVVGGEPDAASEECRRLLAEVRARCPDLVPGRPLQPAEVGPEIPLDKAAGASLFPLVARQIVGLPTDKPDDPGVVVLTQGADELAVEVAKITVITAPGAIGITLPVHCDQSGEATVQVRFALGSDARPAGLIASTDERPFGPAAVVDAWGEALTALAWQLLLTTATKLADATGRDVDGAGLIPAAVRATDAGIAVLTMARHTFDRTGAE
jgi:hypothetical protein